MLCRYEIYDLNKLPSTYDFKSLIHYYKSKTKSISIYIYIYTIQTVEC